MAGIYIHIPFCKQACTYCNFHFSTSLRQKGSLLEALHKEIHLQKDWLKGAPIETVYLGGGTPSLLSAEELSKLFELLFNVFKISDLKECTLEANPDDLNNSYLRSLKQTPVDRLSIGIQSFHEADLRYMNRAHTAQQSDYALKAAQDIGFTNLSIDLIYGTPGLTDTAWKDNLARMAALDIPHFSSYALTVEEGTALHHSIAKKSAAPVDAAQSAAQTEILMDEAARLGYEQYEISNFSRPGCYAVHNTAYWEGAPYLGIGPSAHSFNGTDTRRWNIANNSLYIQNILSNSVIPFEEEKLTSMQRLNEYIMTSLRTMWGTDLAKVADVWGSNYSEQLLLSAQPFLLGSKLTRKDQKLVLTNVGKLFADGIAADLFFTDEA